MIGFLSGLILLRLGPCPQGMGSCLQAETTGCQVAGITQTAWVSDSVPSVYLTLPSFAYWVIYL